MNTEEQHYNEIRQEVTRVLSKQKDNILVIKSAAELHDYITKVLSIRIVAVDTETNNSLDPLTCRIMGLCLYAPGLKQAYIPVNHRDRATGKRWEWQVTEWDIQEELTRIIDAKTFVVMHNGKFDYQVLKCTCGVSLQLNWDTMIAAQLLNENEKSALKWQYHLHIDPSQEKYSIEGLFDKAEYADVEPEIFAIYAATDSLMTYKLYEYQWGLMSTTEMGLWRLFAEIELPVSIVAAEMELYGACVDLNYLEKLKEKYSAKSKEISGAIQACLDELADVIQEWRQTPESQKKEATYPSPSENKRLTPEQLEKKYPLIDDRTGKRYKLAKDTLAGSLTSPIKVSSPKQLKILFYEVFGVLRARWNDNGKTDESSIRNISSRFTEIKAKVEGYIGGNVDLGESVNGYIGRYSRIFAGGSEKESLQRGVERLDRIIDLCELLSEERKVSKLISTYLNPVPGLAGHWPDGKVRFHLKTLGAATGRFSSGGDWRYIENGNRVKLPGMNQQSLPSENHEIRLMFRAGEGRVFVGADFSQQEPSVAAFISQDKKMLETFRAGRDIYATIAAAIYKLPYELNLEFADPEKTILVDNGHGKERRKVGKVVILASMYGMSEATVAHMLKLPREEAHRILDEFFREFPGLKRAQDATVQGCKKDGYVTGIWGRKRRLPDMQLPHYSIEFASASRNKDKNARAIWEIYQARVQQLNTQDEFLPENEFELLRREARKNNVIIVSNEDRIRKAQCQCFNARIQGSAATITKVAMLLIYNDPCLRSYDAHLVFQIHDEVVVDCPAENAEPVKARLTKLMESSVKVLGVTLPLRCDPVIEKRWGEGSVPGELRDRLNKLERNGVEDPLSALCAEYPNFPPESIEKVINTGASIIEFQW